MFVPRWAFNGRHPTTELCSKGEEQKIRRLVVEEASAGANMALATYVHPLVAVS